MKNAGFIVYVAKEAAETKAKGEEGKEKKMKTKHTSTRKLVYSGYRCNGKREIANKQGISGTVPIKKGLLAAAEQASSSESSNQIALINPGKFSKNGDCDIIFDCCNLACIATHNCVVSERIWKEALKLLTYGISPFSGSGLVSGDPTLGLPAAFPSSPFLCAPNHSLTSCKDKQPRSEICHLEVAKQKHS